MRRQLVKGVDPGRGKDHTSKVEIGVTCFVKHICKQSRIVRSLALASDVKLSTLEFRVKVHKALQKLVEIYDKLLILGAILNKAGLSKAKANPKWEIQV